MHYKQVANRWKEKWQTGGRDKCLSAAEPSEFLKVWLIRIPSFCVDDSNSVPILPLPIIFFCTIGPGSSIHKLYDLRSPNSQPSELGNLTTSDLARPVSKIDLDVLAKHVSLLSPQPSAIGRTSRFS